MNSIAVRKQIEALIESGAVDDEAAATWHLDSAKHFVWRGMVSTMKEHMKKADALLASPESKLLLQAPGMERILELFDPVSMEFRHRAPIFVQDLCAHLYMFEFDASDTVGDLKIKIQLKRGIPPDMQRLIKTIPGGGIQLQDGCTLAHYNIRVESVVHLVLRLGGPPKSW